MSAIACSTVIVGKDGSATGEILIGHNEDNGGRLFNHQCYVPLARPGKTQSFMPADVATRERLNARDSRFSYHPEYAHTSLSITPTP